MFTQPLMQFLGCLNVHVGANLDVSDDTTPGLYVARLICALFKFDGVFTFLRCNLKFHKSRDCSSFGEERHPYPTLRGPSAYHSVATYFPV